MNNSASNNRITKKAFDELKQRLEREIAGREQAEKGQLVALAEMSRAVQQLQESEERYHAIFEQASDPIVLIDVKTKTIVEFNTKTHENLGYTREEFKKLERSDFDVFESPKLVKQVRKALQKRGSHTFETKHRTKSGEIRDILVSARIISIRERDFIQSIWYDITERRQTEEIVRQRNQELTLLNRAAHALSSSLDLDQVLDTILDEVRHLLDAVACLIWLIDSETNELVCQQTAGMQSDIARGWRLAPGEGFGGWTVRTGESLIVPDAQADTRHLGDIDQQTGLTLRSVLSVPLQAKDEAIGVLQVVDTEAGRFDASDLDLLEPLATNAAIAIENARLYKETDELRAFNENIVQSLEEGIVLDNPTGHITFTNSKMAELLGYSPDELIGQHWTTFVAPEYLAKIEKETDKRSLGVASRYESAILNREGERVPVLVSARPLFKNGQITGVLAVFTDIAERKKAEADIRRYNEELIALNRIAVTLNQSLDRNYALNVTLNRVLEIIAADAGWIQLFDENKNILTLVAHRGFSQKTIREAKILELEKSRAADKFPYIRQINTEMAQCEGLHTFASIPIKSKDSVLGLLSLFTQNQRQVNSQEKRLLTAIAHQVGTAIENISLAEEKSEIEILRELNRLRSELVTNVSHELRTPLGLIKFFATSLLMEDADFDWDTQLQFLRGINDEADKLEVIVNNLLDISQVKSGRLRLNRQPTNMSQLLKDIIGVMNVKLEPGVQAAQHYIAHDFPSEPLMASVDAKRIEQVMRNLLHNAAKYSPDGGTITVWGRGDTEQILIWVSDQGVGIPHQDLDQVFERFYRVNNKITQKTRGVGLGLFICKNIVEAHGGRIWTESALGKGSTFYFTIPLTTAKTFNGLINDQERDDEKNKDTRANSG